MPKPSFNAMPQKDQLTLVAKCFRAVAMKVARREVALKKGAPYCALGYVRDELLKRVKSDRYLSIYDTVGTSNVVSPGNIWFENDGVTHQDQGPAVGHQDADGMADILLVASLALEDEARAL